VPDQGDGARALSWVCFGLRISSLVRNIPKSSEFFPQKYFPIQPRIYSPSQIKYQVCSVLWADLLWLCKALPRRARVVQQQEADVRPERRVKLSWKARTSSAESALRPQLAGASISGTRESAAKERRSDELFGRLCVAETDDSVRSKVPTGAWHPLQSSHARMARDGLVPISCIETSNGPKMNALPLGQTMIRFFPIAYSAKASSKTRLQNRRIRGISAVASSPRSSCLPRCDSSGDATTRAVLRRCPGRDCDSSGKRALAKARKTHGPALSARKTVKASSPESGAPSKAHGGKTGSQKLLFARLAVSGAQYQFTCPGV
jgi:hypothetical protein